MIEQSVIKDLDESTLQKSSPQPKRPLTKQSHRQTRLRDYMVKLLREQVAGFTI
jgi:hypothetical protein